MKIRLLGLLTIMIMGMLGTTSSAWGESEVTGNGYKEGQYREVLTMETKTLGAAMYRFMGIAKICVMNELENDKDVTSAVFPRRWYTDCSNIEKYIPLKEKETDSGDNELVEVSEANETIVDGEDKNVFSPEYILDNGKYERTSRGRPEGMEDCFYAKKSNYLVCPKQYNK